MWVVNVSYKVIVWFHYLCTTSGLSKKLPSHRYLKDDKSTPLQRTWCALDPLNHLTITYLWLRKAISINLYSCTQFWDAPQRCETFLICNLIVISSLVHQKVYWTKRHPFSLPYLLLSILNLSVCKEVVYCVHWVSRTPVPGWIFPADWKTLPESWWNN